MKTLDTLCVGSKLYIANTAGIREAKIVACTYYPYKNRYLVEDRHITRRIEVANEDLNKQTIQVDGESVCATPTQAAAACLYYRINADNINPFKTTK